MAGACREVVQKVVAGIAPARGDKAPPAQSFIVRMRAGLERFDGQVLILLSGRDLTAQAFREIASADAAWQRAMARPQVRQIELPAADHTFSTRREFDRANEHCLSWLHELDVLRSGTAGPVVRSSVG